MVKPLNNASHVTGFSSNTHVNYYEHPQRGMLNLSAETITRVEPNMSMEPGNLFALIDVLLHHNVPLVIIGGHAVVYHGYVRATEDVDVIFHRTSQSEKDLFAALFELEAYWIGNEIDSVTGIEKTYSVTMDYISRTHLMMLGTKLGYLDVFDFVPELPSADIQQVIESCEYLNARPFVSLDWLQRMKAASPRAKDRDDLRQLTLTRQPRN